MRQNARMNGQKGPVGGCSTGRPSRLSAVSVPSIAVCRPVVWRFTFPPGQGGQSALWIPIFRSEWAGVQRAAHLDSLPYPFPRLPYAAPWSGGLRSRQGKGDRALYGFRFSRREFTSGRQPGGPAIVARHGTSLLAVIPPDSPWLAIAHEPAL